MSITEIAIKRPSLIVVIFAVLGFLGVLGYTKLNYELLPKFESPVVSVTTIYPGASPSEVENSVTKRVEDALSNLENLDEIRSTSMEGVSSVILMLKEGSNTDIAVQDAQRKINAIMSVLPDDTESPVLGKFSMSDAPIMRLGVTAKMPPSELYSLVKDDILPILGKIEGAAQITMIGGEEREIKIMVNRQKAETFGISMMQISNAVKAANLDFPTGKIKNDDAQSLIRLQGKYKSLDEIRNLVIVTDRQTNSAIRLNEVAQVTDGIKEIKTFNRINGKNSIGLSIQKQNDANAVALSAKVKTELKNIEKQYADKGLTFDVASDSSDFTLAAADAVITDLGLAIFIVALCMLLFLHSLRNSLIVMIAIPASLISVFGVMYLLGFSLNLMTLLAISLVVGILVDDSIVVLENIYRHLEMGEDRRTAAAKGRAEIGFTAIGITLVDVVVFLPITMVGGIISNLLSQFSIVIVVSTLMSLFVSFTVTPLLASRMAKVEYISTKLMTGKLVAAFERFLTWLTNAYGNVLKFALGHKRYVLTGVIALFFSSFLLVTKGFIGTEFVSSGDNGEFMITLELPQEATIAQTNEATMRVEEYLFKKGEVTNVFSNIGSTSGQMGSSQLANKSELNVKLVDKTKREQTSAIIAQFVKLDLQKILPDVKVNSAAVSIAGGANSAPVQMSVTGNSLDTNLVVASQLMDKLKTIKGTSEVKMSVETGNPEVTVNIDRDKMSELGLSLDIVGANMQGAFSGTTSAKYNDGGKEFDINIILDAFDRKNATDLSNLFFINNRGEKIGLTQFATIGHATGPNKLERKNRVPSITISSQVLGVSSGEVSDKMAKYLETTTLPVGTVAAFEGSTKNMNDAFANLFYALFASILFVYLIMVALYDSYIYPFVVLFSIPLALMGALLALALTMQPLSIFSMLGMIMLMGLVAKNAILIVDFANQLKAAGHNTVEALILAGKTRLRPILMTTLAMMFGMMPIALAHGAGAEWKSGLAWVLIGGLASSMILTLVVVPSVYLIVDMMKGEIKFKQSKKILKSLVPDDMVIEGEVLAV